MEIDRNLLNPFFEGYKLSVDENKCPIVDYFPLKYHSKKLNEEINGPSTDFQILADEIYENKLKTGTGTKFYYLNDEENLISFSTKELKSSLIKGPFECFSIAKEDLVLVKCKGSDDFKLIKVKDDGEDDEMISLSFDDFNFKKCKILEIVKFERNLYVLFQETTIIGNIPNINTEKYKEKLDKPCFLFFFACFDIEDFSKKSFNFIGWSCSRLNYSALKVEGEDGNCRIIIGSSTGITGNGNGKV